MLERKLALFIIIALFLPNITSPPEPNDAECIANAQEDNVTSYWAGRCILGNGFYRPLPSTVFWSSVQLFGDNLMPMKVFAISLHCLNAWLFFGLVFRWTNNKDISFWLTLLFAINSFVINAVLYSHHCWDLFVILGFLLVLYDHNILGGMIALFSKEHGVLVCILAMSRMGWRGLWGAPALLIYLIFWKMVVYTGAYDGVPTVWHVFANFVHPIIPVFRHEGVSWRELALTAGVWLPMARLSPVLLRNPGMIGLVAANAVVLACYPVESRIHTLSFAIYCVILAKGIKENEIKWLYPILTTSAGLIGQKIVHLKSLGW